MTRYFARDVRAALSRLAAAHERAGISRTVRYADGTASTLDYRHLHVETGSKTYGRPWRLFYRDPVTGGLTTAAASDYLGVSAREAVLTLGAMAHGIEAAHEASRRDARALADEEDARLIRKFHDDEPEVWRD